MVVFVSLHRLIEHGVFPRRTTVHSTKTSANVPLKLHSERSVFFMFVTSHTIYRGENTAPIPPQTGACIEVALTKLNEQMDIEKRSEMSDRIGNDKIGVGTGLTVLLYCTRPK